MIESPASAEDREAEKTASELHLRVVKPDASTASQASQEELGREMRDGLKRLSRLVREKKRDGGASHRDGSTLNGEDRSRRRALRVYRFISEAKDPRSRTGENIDHYA